VKEDTPEPEITAAMIRAGADVLLADSFLDLGPFIAGHVAERVLRHALEARRAETPEGVREET
jgi:hypothetical protein